ncbi:MAG: hypothetical protein HOB73_15750 [Planctomycetaceae bacterium]|jgi:hypothetical protein|nr:hypothetical protein [Planctomycetaceae bacterium]
MAEFILFVVVVLSIVPQVFFLMFVRHASNNNRGYQPFSKPEIKQTMMEIVGIAVVGTVLFCIFQFTLINIPFLYLFLGLPSVFVAYALAMKYFWDMDLIMAFFWSFVLVGLYVLVGPFLIMIPALLL